MRSTLIFSALASLVALYRPALSAEPIIDQPYSVTSDNRLVTEVMLNGKGPFKMVLDTGCSQTTLLKHTAKALGIEPASNELINVYSIAAESSSLPFVIREIKLSDTEISNLTVVVIDDPSDYRGPVPDGIIGVDILERYAIVFDSVKGRLKLFPRQDGVPEPYSQWRHIPMTPKAVRGANANFWFIDADYNGIRAKTLFDLGIGTSLVTWRLAEAILPLAKMPRKQDERVRDALGKGLPAFRIEDITIAVAGHYWLYNTVLVADAPIFQRLDVAYLPIGVIGAGILSDKSFALDFESQRLYIAPKT
ncbi:MAG: retropepsin-like aspartic protease [Alphaproteobacteria bacterium]